MTIRVRKNLPSEPKPGPKSDRGHAYRPQIGALLWLTRCFRPDLSRAAGILGSAVECWSDEHTEFLDALLGVVLHTKDAKMVMRYKL